MAFFSPELNDHGKDPNRMWGRYLTSTSATCVIADSDTNSELELVCYIIINVQTLQLCVHFVVY